MGPFQWLELPCFPDFKFQQGFVLLALASVYGEGGIPRRRLLWNGIDYALLVFVGACLLSIAGSFMYRTPVRLFVDAMLVPCAFYLIAKKCASKLEFLGKLYLVAVIGIIAFGALGLCEAATGRNILDYGEPELDIFRVNGPMRMAEDYGLVMSMLMLFSFAMARLRPLRSVGPGYQRLCSLIGLLAVANTLTRGIWLGLGLGWLVQFARRAGSQAQPPLADASAPDSIR